MSKKVIKSSNKNEKYNLKSVLDTDNIMSGVSLKAVTAIGCASVIASCGDDKPKDDGKKDENKLKWDDFKDYQSKFKNGKTDFENFLKKCKEQGISEDEIKEMIEQLSESDVQNVLKGEIKKENGKITIAGKAINMNETNLETNDTLSNFNNLSEKQQETLKTYGITNQNTLDEFLNIKDNEGFKDKKISELFNEKDIKDENLKTKLEAYKNSKQPSTPQVNEEKVKKLKELIQHDDGNYTIYNFVESNVKKTEIDKIYELIKGKTLTDEDKDVSKNDSLAKKLKDIIENKNNIKDVQLAIFKKIVENLSKDKKYFEFSSDNKKQFQINIKFTLKNEKGENKTETESKTYKPEDINIQEQLDIENHKIYTESSSLKEIEKSSIDEAFKLENAKKDGKDIANGAGETKDLNAYLVVLKDNFDKLKELNISNDAIKTKIYGQLLKNIQAKLTDFVDNKLSTQVKDKTPNTNAIVAAMKSTGICKQDASVTDAASMKNNPIDGKFFLSDIIASGGFMHSDYETMIDAMFTYFNDKYKVDNASKFKKNITDLKADDFTANDANTKLKIDANNNNTCTYFEEDSAPTLTGYDKFAEVINKINAIGNVQIGGAVNDTFNSGKTLANATKIDYVNLAFKAIHAVRKALDDVIADDTNDLIKESQLYKFLEKIVGTEEEFKISLGWYGDGSGNPSGIKENIEYHPTATKYLKGLLPLAIMIKATNHKLDNATFFGTDVNKTLGVVGGNLVGQFQLSLNKLAILYLNGQHLSWETANQNDHECSFDLGNCTGKNNTNAEANQIGLSVELGTVANFGFANQIKSISDKINTHDKVNEFLDSYVRKMFIPAEIKYTGAKKTEAPGTAIFVDPNWQGSDKNKIITAAADTFAQKGLCLTVGDIGTYLLPVLGPIHLIAGFKALNNAGADMQAASVADKITYQNRQYVYDFTNNRSALVGDVGELAKESTDKSKYTYGVTLNK